MATIGSKEYRENMQLSQAKYSKPVDQLHIYTKKLIRSFTSIHQAAKVTGINRTSIRRACNGDYNRAGLFYWRWAA